MQPEDGARCPEVLHPNGNTSVCVREKGHDGEHNWWPIEIAGVPQPTAPHQCNIGTCVICGRYTPSLNAWAAQKELRSKP
jgi:hypothetical protein